MWACQNYAGKARTKTKFLREEARKNRLRVAEILIQAGADVNVQTDVSMLTLPTYVLTCVSQGGWNPLMQASQDNAVEIVKLLVQAKDVRIDHQNKVPPKTSSCTL